MKKGVLQLSLIALAVVSIRAQAEMNLPLILAENVVAPAGPVTPPAPAQPAAATDGAVQFAPKQLIVQPEKQPEKPVPPPKPVRKVVKLQAPATPVEPVQPKPVRPAVMPLPGLGTVDGDPRLMKANLVRLSGDGTEVVQISSAFQNRIATPFESPRVIDSSDAVFKVDGSNIFLTPASDKPIVIYVTGSEKGDPVLSMTLTPRPIPAQTIILQLEPSMARTPEKQEKAATYEEKLRNLMRSAALGRAPDGFSESPIDSVVGRMGALIVTPQTRYSNARLDVFVYRIENSSDRQISLSESAFYQKGVRAVGLYPASTLGHSESTYLYVISDKSALARDEGAR